jgi:hypothetical protein
MAPTVVHSRSWPQIPVRDNCRYAQALVDSLHFSEPLRRDLLRYLAATSKERAHLIGELGRRNPGLANLLVDLEADDDLRSRFEMELLRSLHS